VGSRGALRPRADDGELGGRACGRGRSRHSCLNASILTLWPAVSEQVRDVAAKVANPALGLGIKNRSDPRRPARETTTTEHGTYIVGEGRYFSEGVAVTGSPVLTLTLTTKVTEDRSWPFGGEHYACRHSWGLSSQERPGPADWRSPTLCQANRADTPSWSGSRKLLVKGKAAEAPSWISGTPRQGLSKSSGTPRTKTIRRKRSGLRRRPEVTRNGQSMGTLTPTSGPLHITPIISIM
jgi:hypothetical protein